MFADNLEPNHDNRRGSVPTTDDSTIIRTGSDSRLRYSPDQKQSLLAAFDRSGISAMAFARQHGVQYQTFIVWLRKRRELVIKTTTLAMLTDGIDLRDGLQRPWYELR